MYLLKKQNFEERFYSASRWLMIEVEDLTWWTVYGGLTKLGDYMNGNNEASESHLSLIIFLVNLSSLFSMEFSLTSMSNPTIGRMKPIYCCLYIYIWVIHITFLEQNCKWLCVCKEYVHCGIVF